MTSNRVSAPFDLKKNPSSSDDLPKKQAVATVHAEDPAAADDEEPNQGAEDADSAETEDEAGGAGAIGAAEAVGATSRAVG